MSDVGTLYLAWQDPVTRCWHVVGRLKSMQGRYYFGYTKGAEKSSNFRLFSGMEDLKETYVSEQLFPLFQNRLLSSRRPEYPEFIRWLGLTEQESDPIEILARSGGVRATDQLQVFKKVEVSKEGTFSHLFFVHGLRYLSESALHRVREMKPKDRLYLLHDSQNDQNDQDGMAVVVRAENPAEIVGYCPRYLAEDICRLLTKDPKSLVLSVEVLSPDAPPHYQLMCRLEGSVPTSSGLMEGDEFVALAAE